MIMSEKLHSREERPWYYKECRPHNCRRKTGHDYKLPCSYMITLSKTPGAPVFSSIIGDPRGNTDPVRVVLSETGRIIETLIKELNDRDPRFDLYNRVIMPDHVHIIWRVKNNLPKDLGYYIGLLKSRCTMYWRRGTACEATIKEFGLFLPKFNDVIAYDHAIERQLTAYVWDNPRRRRTKQLYSHLFKHAQCVRILDRKMDIYGNFQLLRHPLIAAVVVSSRYTPEERRWHQQMIEEAIRTGGVLVSPFISRAEREIMNRGIEAGASIIRIIPDGMGPRYKPPGREFDLCAAGRCLHIGLPRKSAHVDTLTRECCLELNAMAHWLASHPAERMSLLLQ